MKKASKAFLLICNHLERVTKGRFTLWKRIFFHSHLYIRLIYRKKYVFSHFLNRETKPLINFDVCSKALWRSLILVLPLEKRSLHVMKDWLPYFLKHIISLTKPYLNESSWLYFVTKHKAILILQVLSWTVVTLSEMHTLFTCGRFTQTYQNGWKNALLRAFSSSSHKKWSLFREN